MSHLDTPAKHLTLLLSHLEIHHDGDGDEEDGQDADQEEEEEVTDGNDFDDD